MKNIILFSALFILIGCSKEDEIIAYDCVPETYKRSEAVYDESQNEWGYYAFGKFKEDKVIRWQTSDVPVWVENETLILNYSQELWNPSDMFWLNDWQRNVMEEGGECYKLESLIYSGYACNTLSRVFFNTKTVTATKIFRVTKDNVWLDKEFRDIYKPNYYVPDKLDYDRKDYTLDRISRKLTLKHLATTYNNEKIIDEFTYQCSEKKLSGQI